MNGAGLVQNTAGLKVVAPVVIAILLLAGCGSSSASPSPKAKSSVAASPTSSSTASPAPITGAFAVLATPMSADTYTVAIVGIDGKVVASAQASSPTPVTCGNASAAVVPLPISTSDDRAYYMDAQGVVRFLTVQGESGRATTVPVGGGRRSMFAVSPDDQRVAVIVSDFTSSGVSLKLYVEDLNGGTNHVDIFTSSGAFGLWPIGWHGTNNLVVAKVPSCTQGGGPLCCGPLELHVVDPATAVRRFTLGGPDCVIAGAASPAGVVCETTAVDGFKVDWTGARVSLGVAGERHYEYLSPDGQRLANVFSSTRTTVGSSATIIGSTANTLTLTMEVCGWIDNTHVIANGDAQHQPRVADATNGHIVPVAALGTCAGRIPGGL